MREFIERKVERICKEINEKWRKENDMSRSKLINDISNRIELNKYYISAVVTNDTVRKEFERNNRLLEDIKAILYSDLRNNQYTQGTKDAWNLAFKIAGSPCNGCYDNKELVAIFDCMDSCEVFDSYSYITALRLIEEYEKKKEEEAKLVPGDVIVVKGMTYGNMKGIFIKYEGDDLIVLTRKGGSVRLVTKDTWNIEKTGEHVNISELIEVFYND